MVDNTQNLGLAALLKQNKALAKHAAVAKKAQAVRDFAGPPGEYVVTFVGPKVVLKDGAQYFILQFKCDGSVPHQAPHNGASMNVLHNLSGDDRRTPEQCLENLMRDLQRMSIDTAELEIPEIDTALKGCINQQFKMRVVPGKNDPNKRYYNILGMNWGDEDPTSEPEPAVEPAPAKPATKRTPKNVVKAAPEPAGDEWNAELDDPTGEDLDSVTDDSGEPETEQDTPVHADYSPSDWVDYEVQYQAPKSPKALTYKVTAADDKKQTLTIERAGKSLTVPYLSVTLP
jgi:hypothetical protein